MLKFLPLLFLIGCASSVRLNIIDITEDQWIEDIYGNRCIEKQMIINPETIDYLYSNCEVRKIVKPKIHTLPKPAFK